MLAAIEKGDAEELAELIRLDPPGFNVNMDQDGSGGTLLHYACDRDSRSAVIPLLLAHPDIDVNVENKGGWIWRHLIAPHLPWRLGIRRDSITPGPS